MFGFELQSIEPINMMMMIVLGIRISFERTGSVEIIDFSPDHSFVME